MGRCPIGTDREVTYSQTEARRTKGASEEPLEQRADCRKQKPRGRHLRTHWPISTSEAGPTDHVGFIGIIDPLFIYTRGSWGRPLLTATVTYENTTEDFAAATVTADPQGLRIYYYTLAPGRRTIGIVPWELEAGSTYRLVYGIDAGDDGKIDISTEQRDFVFPQHGSPVQIDVESRTNYVVEIDQLQRGELIGPAPDPGLSAQDTRYNPARNLPTARIYNVSFQPIRNIKIAFYDGFPSAGGKPIAVQQIPNIENPNDLEPRMVTVGVNYRLDQPTDIYVAIDPDDEINSEITALNNVAHKRLMDSGVNAKQPAPKPAKLLRKRGRRG